MAERNIAETVATQYSFPYLEPDQYYISGDIIHLLPMEIIEKHAVVPLDRFGDILTVVVAGPLDEEVIKEIEQTTGCRVHIFVSTVSAVKKTVDTLKEGQRRAAVRRE